MREDRTALSWWFPKIEAAGVPVPRTTIIKMPKEAQESIWQWFDGKSGNGAEKPFLAELKAAATAIGFPCFLRTDHTSDKHSWEKTCFLKSADDVPQHVYNIAEFSEICDMVGLPWNSWVVREFSVLGSSHTLNFRVRCLSDGSSLIFRQPFGEGSVSRHPASRPKRA